MSKENKMTIGWPAWPPAPRAITKDNTMHNTSAWRAHNHFKTDPSTSEVEVKAGKMEADSGFSRIHGTTDNRHVLDVTTLQDLGAMENLTIKDHGIIGGPFTGTGRVVRPKRSSSIEKKPSQEELKLRFMENRHLAKKIEMGRRTLGPMSADSPIIPKSLAALVAGGFRLFTFNTGSNHFLESEAEAPPDRGRRSYSPANWPMAPRTGMSGDLELDCVERVTDKCDPIPSDAQRSAIRPDHSTNVTPQAEIRQNNSQDESGYDSLLTPDISQAGDDLSQHQRDSPPREKRDRVGPLQSTWFNTEGRDTTSTRPLMSVPEWKKQTERAMSNSQNTEEFSAGSAASDSEKRFRQHQEALLRPDSAPANVMDNSYNGVFGAQPGQYWNLSNLQPLPYASNHMETGQAPMVWPNGVYGTLSRNDLTSDGYTPGSRSFMLPVNFANMSQIGASNMNMVQNVGYQTPPHMAHSLDFNMGTLNGPMATDITGRRLSPTAPEFSLNGSVNPNRMSPYDLEFRASHARRGRGGLVVPNEPRRREDWSALVAKIVNNSDQQASITMQQKIKQATGDEKFAICQAIINETIALSTNRFGNFLVQRCMEQGTFEQIINIADILVGNVQKLSQDNFGCHVMQKALDTVPEEYKVIFIEELLVDILATIYHKYACHVWQKLFELRWDTQPPNIMTQVNLQVAGYWTIVALGETGSLVVQNIFENCIEEEKRPCLDEVLDNIAEISRGQFGNWCIQHIVEHGSEPDRLRALSHILDQAALYSTDQYGSKVIEKCLKVAPGQFLEAYLNQIMIKQDGRPRSALIDIAGDQYGNYLIQWILQNCPQHLHNAVSSQIRQHMVSLRGSKYGSRVAVMCNNPGFLRPTPARGAPASNPGFHRGNSAYN